MNRTEQAKALGKAIVNNRLNNFTKPCECDGEVIGACALRIIHQGLTKLVDYVGVETNIQNQFVEQIGKNRCILVKDGIPNESGLCQAHYRIKV